MIKYMKKIKYFSLTLLILFLVYNIDLVLESTKSASILFFEKVFICTFPFIILSDILIYFDYHIFLKNTIGKIFSKLFNIDPNTSIVIILSLLTSLPANSIYIKNMLDNKLIDINEANKLLTFTYFPSISFVFGVVGFSLYNDLKIGLLLYLNCLIYNFLIGIYLRKDKFNYINKTNIENKSSFMNTIKNSIVKAISSCSLILGNLIIFIVIINLLNKYITFNEVLTTFVGGLLELTSGVINIYNLDISLVMKLLLTSFILNFSSLSIIFQSVSILDGYKINIKKILIIKLIFSTISTLLFTILLLLLHI